MSQLKPKKTNKQTIQVKITHHKEVHFLEFYFVPIDIEEKQNTKNCEYKKAQS